MEIILVLAIQLHFVMPLYLQAGYLIIMILMMLVNLMYTIVLVNVMEQAGKVIVDA